VARLWRRVVSSRRRAPHWAALPIQPVVACVQRILWRAPMRIAMYLQEGILAQSPLWYLPEVLDH
jgi:hypothetical protein